MRLARVLTSSIFLGHKTPAGQGGRIIVGVLFGALGQFDFFLPYLLIGNDAQEMRDAVEACALLVVGSHNVPGRGVGIGGIEHHVARAGVIVPARAWGQVYRAQLPLTKRVLDESLISPRLL